MTGIAANLQTQTPLTPAQQDWLQQTSLPVYVLFKQYLHDPNAMTRFAAASARLVAAEAIRHYVWNLTRRVSAGVAAFKQRHPHADVDLSVVRAGLRAVEADAQEIARKEAQRIAANLRITTEMLHQAEWTRRMR